MSVSWLVRLSVCHESLKRQEFAIPSEYLLTFSSIQQFHLFQKKNLINNLFKDKRKLNFIMVSISSYCLGTWF